MYIQNKKRAKIFDVSMTIIALLLITTTIFLAFMALKLESEGRSLLPIIKWSLLVLVVNIIFQYFASTVKY
jgi:hypothetical protein